MSARIAAIDYVLPERVVSNEELSAEFPEWSVEKIGAKTGILRRHIAADDEFASDLAIAAGERLFASAGIDRSSIDYLIVCTQSPDYALPSTACIVQDGLGLPTSTGATDITLGCSGYVYALALAKGLIESGLCARVLVITTDTYSKYLNGDDKSVRTIFGDGAAATLVTDDGDARGIHAITYGTDGAGAKSLIVPRGGLRDGTVLQPAADPAARGLTPGTHDLFMDGPDIFNFTLRVVPPTVSAILDKAGCTIDDIDLFVFHQANAFMLEHLRKKIGVPSEKFFVSIAESGNTVSSTIPIALTDAARAGALTEGMRVMLVGFGVGLSWGGLIATW